MAEAQPGLGLFFFSRFFFFFPSPFPSPELPALGAAHVTLVNLPEGQGHWAFGKGVGGTGGESTPGWSGLIGFWGRSEENSLFSLFNSACRKCLYLLSVLRDPVRRWARTMRAPAARPPAAPRPAYGGGGMGVCVLGAGPVGNLKNIHVQLPKHNLWLSFEMHKSLHRLLIDCLSCTSPCMYWATSAGVHV